MERMAEVVPESDEQVLQHFLSNSNWDERGVLDQVALDADALLGGTDDSVLLIDESGFTKKDHKSVRVARRWNGQPGPVSCFMYFRTFHSPSRAIAPGGAFGFASAKLFNLGNRMRPTAEPPF